MCRCEWKTRQRAVNVALIVAVCAVSIGLPAGALWLVATWLLIFTAPIVGEVVTTWLIGPCPPPAPSRAPEHLERL